MAGNALCPQDYVDMIDEYIARGQGCINKQQILNYCIKHSKELDPGDEAEISDLIDAVINLGLQQGALRKSTFGYYVNHPIEGGTVGPEVRPMRELDQASINAIKELDKKATLQMFDRSALRRKDATLDQPLQILD